jgi:hypothetical protein
LVTFRAGRSAFPGGPSPRTPTAPVAFVVRGSWFELALSGSTTSRTAGAR